MDFEIAVIGVGLAREQAFELAPCRLGAQLLERRLGLGDDRASPSASPSSISSRASVDLALDPPVATDRLVELGALAQQLLRRSGVVPEARVLGLRVQLGEASGCSLPVKDASSAAPTTC